MTKITIIQGSEADALLASDVFRAEWSRVHDACPWATGFQSHAFAAAWYGAYRALFEPVLAISRAADGGLHGLLALARDASGRRLIVAGGHQAEYQGWICRPEVADAFPAALIGALRFEFPSRSLVFRYLPPRTPLAWLPAHEAAPLCVLRSHPRPLLRLGDGSFARSLLKERSIRPRYRRLMRMGMQFRRVTDPTEFEQIFDEVIRYYDFRRLAIGGSAPFVNDPFKKSFHLAMLRYPELAHATVMTVDDQLVGAEINICGRREMHLAFGAQNPWFGKQAPGKVHIPLLAEMLPAQEYEQIDLTPGGDVYKDQIANAEDEVHTLTICPDRVRRAGVALLDRGRESAKALLARYSVQPGRVKAVARDVLLHPVAAPPAVLRAARAWVGPPRETLIYCRETREADHARPPLPRDVERVRRDAIDDLMAYHPGPAGPSRQAFCLDAQRRCADGQHCYTQLDRRGRLAHVAWLADRPAEPAIAQWLPGLALPPDTALVLGLYRVGRGRGGRGLEGSALRMMLRDAAAVGGAKRTIVLVPSGDDAVRCAVGDLGFVRVGSLCESWRFGREHRCTRLDVPIGPEQTAPVPAPTHQPKRQTRSPLAIVTSTVGGMR